MRVVKGLRWLVAQQRSVGKLHPALERWPGRCASATDQWPTGAAKATAIFFFEAAGAV